MMAPMIPTQARQLIAKLIDKHKNLDDSFRKSTTEAGVVHQCITPLLEALQHLQREPAQGMRIRTALVTARSAPAHERAIRTLMGWSIEVDEALFLGGLGKGEFLREFEPDFFFDDQTGHIENAAAHVPAGHVAAGVANG